MLQSLHCACVSVAKLLLIDRNAYCRRYIFLSIHTELAMTCML